LSAADPTAMASAGSAGDDPASATDAARIRRKIAQMS
jgi:hypothetical protein